MRVYKIGSKLHFEHLKVSAVAAPAARCDCCLCVAAIRTVVSISILFVFISTTIFRGEPTEYTVFVWKVSNWHISHSISFQNGSSGNVCVFCMIELEIENDFRCTIYFKVVNIISLMFSWRCCCCCCRFCFYFKCSIVFTLHGVNEMSFLSRYYNFVRLVL